MRALVFAAAAFLAACESTPPPPDPEVVSPADEKPLPDYRPETGAACNAVKLSVAMARDGSLTVNGAPSDMAALQAAAAEKDTACRNAPAMVGLSIATGVKDKDAEALRDVLAKAITNLALVESAN
jgi:hypothetical protein